MRAISALCTAVLRVLQQAQLAGNSVRRIISRGHLLSWAVRDRRYETVLELISFRKPNLVSYLAFACSACSAPLVVSKRAGLPCEAARVVSSQVEM